MRRIEWPRSRLLSCPGKGCTTLLDTSVLLLLPQRHMPASFSAGEKRPRAPGGQADFGQFRFSAGSCGGAQQQHLEGPGCQVSISRQTPH